MKTFKELEEFKKFLPNNNFCTAPFMHTHINVNNRGFKLCCMSHVVGRFDDLDKKPLEEKFNEWWTGKEMQDIRKQFLDGKMPSVCSWWCGKWEKEKVASNADRLAFTKKYKETFGHLNFNWSVKNGTEEFKKPIDVDLRPSKLCNLKCRSCNSIWSDKIEKEVLANPEIQGWSHWDNVTKSKANMERAKKINWEDPNYDIVSSLNLDKVLYLKMSGGETLLDTRVYRILKKIVDNGSSNKMKLHLIVNGTVFPERTKLLLKKFKHVRFNLSIDATESTEDYLRHGTKWENKLKVIDELFNYGDVGILCTMQPIVLWEIRKTTEYFLSLKKKYGNKLKGVMYNSMVDPWYLHSGWLDKEDKDIIRDEIEQTIFFNKMNKDTLWWFDTVYTELNYDFKELNTKYANDFVKSNIALDKIRGTDTLKIAPFLKKYYDRYDKNNITDSSMFRPAAQFKKGKPYAKYNG